MKGGFRLDHRRRHPLYPGRGLPGPVCLPLPAAGVPVQQRLDLRLQHRAGDHGQGSPLPPERRGAAAGGGAVCAAGVFRADAENLAAVGGSRADRGQPDLCHRILHQNRKK